MNLRIERLITDGWFALRNLDDYESSISEEDEVKQKKETAYDWFEVCVFVELPLESEVEGGNEAHEDHIWYYEAEDPVLKLIVIVVRLMKRFWYLRLLIHDIGSEGDL